MPLRCACAKFIFLLGSPRSTLSLSEFVSFLLSTVFVFQIICFSLVLVGSSEKWREKMIFSQKPSPTTQHIYNIKYGSMYCSVVCRCLLLLLLLFECSSRDWYPIRHLLIKFRCHFQRLKTTYISFTNGTDTNACKCIHVKHGLAVWHPNVSDSQLNWCKSD